MKLNEEFYWDWVNTVTPAVWLCRPEGVGGPWLEVRPSGDGWQVVWQDTLGRRPGRGGLVLRGGFKSASEAKAWAALLYNEGRG